MPEEANFCLLTITVFNRPFAAFLFDMDGTVLNSIAAAERIWSAWAVRHGVDVETFLPTIHGARAIDTINRLNLPGVDAEAASGVHYRSGNRRC